MVVSTSPLLNAYALIALAALASTIFITLFTEKSRLFKARAVVTLFAILLASCLGFAYESYKLELYLFVLGSMAYSVMIGVGEILMIKYLRTAGQT